MSEYITADLQFSFGTLLKILSIKVAVPSSIPVGLVMVGNSPLDTNVFRKESVGLCNV